MDKKLMRSPDKKFCGVCGGLADYFNIDPTIIRIIVAIAAIYTAVVPALLIYFIVALVMPTPPQDYYNYVCNTSRRLTKGHDKKLSGVCSGFAERFNFDTTIIRVVFLLLVLFFGTGILAYIVCACIMPAPVEGVYQPNFGGQPYQGGYNGQPYQNGQQDYYDPQNNQQNNTENN